LLLGSALSLLAWGCLSYVQVSGEERGSVQRDVARDPFAYLRVSMYVTPFFGDDTKRLLTPTVPSDLDVVRDALGKPVSPGAVEKILPAGARVRILRIEFPTAAVLAERPPFTPRGQPWIYLSVDGEQRRMPYVLLLPATLRSRAEVFAAMDDALVKEDPGPHLATYSAVVRDAVLKKQVVVDMPKDALEAAWGMPQQKNISFQSEGRTEVWTYPGKRKAFLRDGRLEKVEGESG
jgi:hypothetical protein